MKSILPSAAVCLLSIAALFPSPLFGNGGGYAWGFESTGDVVAGKFTKVFEPSGTEHVSIQDEQLDITFQAESALVHVEYQMETDGRNRRVTIGFPVEAVHPWHLMPDEGPSAVPLPDFSMALNGKPIETRFVGEPEGTERVDPRRSGIAGWHVGTLQFNAKGPNVLRIECRVPYSAKGGSVSDDQWSSGERFVYRLSTAAVWNGPLRKGRVLLRSSEGLPTDIRITHPPKRFTMQDGVWIWEFEDLAPTPDDDIQVDVWRAHTILGYEFFETEGRWYQIRTTSPENVRASSHLEPTGTITYEPGHAAGSYGNAWVEGVEGDGIGEWIEFTFRPPAVASAIQILGGYYGNTPGGYTREPALWRANNRLKRVAVSINGNAPFEASLPDEYLERHHHMIRVPAALAREPIRTLRLSILEVYRGTEFRDTAISSVSLLCPIKSKPKVEPAR